METATLPPYFWCLYYYFFIFSFAAAITFLFSESNYKKLSLINIVLVITVPYIAFVSSFGTSHPMNPLSNLNELELLIYGLRQGAFSAFYVLFGLLFILSWWGILLFKIRNSEINMPQSRVRFLSGLLVGIGILFFASILNMPVWESLLLAMLVGGLYFLIFNIDKIVCFFRYKQVSSK